MTRVLLVLGALVIFSSGTSEVKAFEEAAKNITLPILTNVELRKKQLSELEANFSVFVKNSEDAHRATVKQLNTVSAEINEVYSRLKTAPSDQIEYLNKKNSLLNDRKQNLLEYHELWKEALAVIDNHIKLVREFIEFLANTKQPYQFAYTWKDFRENQARLAELTVKLDSDRVKREILAKKRLAEIDHANWVAKQLELKQKERERLIVQLGLHEKSKQEDVKPSVIKLEAEVLEEDILGLRHKIDRTKLSIKKIELEIRYWDDFTELEHQKVLEQRTILSQIESRLVLTTHDVEQAKMEWNDEAQKALPKKELLNQLKVNKKQEKNKINNELEYLKDALARNKADGKKNPAEYELIKSQVKRLSALLQAVNEELGFLDAKRELCEASTHEKELQFLMVDVRYKLKQEGQNIDQLIAEFSGGQESARNQLKGLKDKRTDAISSLIETNRLLEKLKESSEELGSKKQSLFKGKENLAVQVATILDDAKRHLLRHLSLTQDLLAVNADLIRYQERLCNQYNLIINDLLARKKMESVWKRSAKAISWHEFTNAMLEGEAFFKEIFWSTPKHLSPIHLVYIGRNFRLPEALGLLLFIVMFFLLFFLVRNLLRRLQVYGPGILEKYQQHSRFLYLTVAFSLVDFALQNFVLLFSWCFLCIHFATQGALLHMVFGVAIAPYYRALFFLISIPILMYLAKQFLATFTKLNQTLSYFFFAERLQDRFVTILSTFCYATAVLIPLRTALLQYSKPSQSPCAAVLLAAYTLILVCVLLFFFTKQEVLRLLPSGHPFFVWLKKKIETYYYPVFLFVMSLFILSNPYIGYSNLAWFLAFVVPASVLFIYGVFLAHYFLRQYSLFMFMTEDEDEFIDKFEHAKAYYSFFVIFSFLFMLLAAIMLLARIWGFNYTPADIWKLLSDEWVLRLGVDKKIGFVEILIVGSFIASAFVFSSIIRRFVLSKLFEILRTEPGTQNTVSRVLHYAIVFLSVILSLSAIHLAEFIFWVGASLGVALGFMLKDVVSDVVSGLFVLLERPLEIGNYIQIDNIEGFVQKIAARTTTIITPRNHSIIIPNTDLLRKPITNWGHGRFAVGFEVYIRVEHSCDPEQVKRIIISVMQANQMVLKAPNVMARLEEIEESALYFKARAFISARRIKEQWEIAGNVRIELWKAFKENRIQFAKPVRMLGIDVQNASTAPKAIEFKFGS